MDDKIRRLRCVSGYTHKHVYIYMGLPWWLSSKESACNAGDADLIPGLESSPGGRHANPLQYSWLENPMDTGAWQATVLRVISLKSEKGIIPYFIFLSKG